MQQPSGFSRSAVDAVREAIDMVDLVSAHTKIERRGSTLVAVCPFHRDTNPSMSVEPLKKLYYCRACGAGGDAFGFHMELTGDNFPTALEYLADRYNVSLPKSSDPEAKARAERADRIQNALNLADVFFRSQLRLAPVPRQYLERRKIPVGLAARFGLGFAPDEWRSLIEDLGRRVSVRDLEAAGLVAFSQKAPDRPYDRFRNRLMFPIRSPSGKVLAFGGRTLGDDRAKYVNTNETERFRKGTVLYGLDEARRSVREQGRLLLVEGYFDVLAAVASGIEWVVASMGTALTAQQVELIGRYTNEVVLGHDGDRAGIEAARKAAAMMLGAGLNVRRAEFPAGQDPDSLRLEEGPAAVRKIVDEAPDAVQVELDSLPNRTELDPRIRSREAGRVKPLLDRIRDPVKRNSYYREAAELLGVTVEELHQSAPSADSSAEQSAPPDRSAPRPPATPSIEEQALWLLLKAASLDHVEWPRPDVFFDPGLRAVYVLMRDQAADGAERIDQDDLYDQMEDRLLIGAERLRTMRLSETDAQSARMRNDIGGAVDRFGKRLLEGLVPQPETESSESRDAPLGDTGNELSGVLGAMVQRHARERLRVLVRDIGRAEREGDREALNRMLQEQQQLSRVLPGRTTPSRNHER